MPLLMWIQAAFTGAAANQGIQLGKNIAKITAALTTFAAISLALKTAIDSALDSISSSAPAGAFLFGLQLLPSNFSTCLAAIAAAHAASVTFIMLRTAMNIRLQGK